MNIADNQKPIFLEFANLYLGDMIYLLDESLHKLEELKALEDGMQNQQNPFEAIQKQ